MNQSELYFPQNLQEDANLIFKISKKRKNWTEKVFKNSKIFFANKKNILIKNRKTKLYCI